MTRPVAPVALALLAGPLTAMSAQEEAPPPMPPPATCQVADTAQLHDELLLALAIEWPGYRVRDPRVAVLQPDVALLAGAMEGERDGMPDMGFWVTAFTCVEGFWTHAQGFGAKRPLREDEGVLRIDVAPAAEILVDGRSRGVRTQLVDTVTAGDHLVRLVPDDDTTYVDTALVVRVQAGAEQAPLDVRLRSLVPVAAPPAFGTLRLAVTPVAEVFVNGASRGVVSRLVDSLPVGEHQVRLVPRDAGYRDSSFVVTVAGDQESPAVTVRLRATVDPTHGVLRISVSPAAEIFLSGQSRGVRSRMADTVLAGGYLLRLVPTDPSYADSTLAVEVAPGVTNPPVVVRLRRR